MQQGSVKGLRSPGAFTVDIAWSGGQLASGKIHSDRGNPCRIRSATVFHVRRAGAPIPLTQVSANLYQFATTVGANYDLIAGADPLTDSDGDGIPDATETALADMGLDPAQDSSAWLALLTEHGPGLGIYTREQLLRAETGSRLLQRPESSDDFLLNIQLEKSDTLDTWAALSLQTEAVPTLDVGVVRFSHASSLPREFYRFSVGDFFTPPGPVLPAVDSTDSDADQIPDVAETGLASMGFAVGPNSSALRQRLIDHAAGLARFTPAAVRGLRVATPANFSKPTPALVSFALRISLENEAGDWATPLFSADDLAIETNTLRVTLPASPETEYYRLSSLP
jgi:hypothetical protein